MDGVQERKTLCRLHHAEHELPGDAPGFLVHPEAAQIVVQPPLAVDPHGRQVVEDDG